MLFTPTKSPSHIQIPHIERVFLDELAPRLHLSPHQDGKDAIRLDNIIQVCRESSKPKAVVTHYLATGESWQAASGYQRRCYEEGLPVYNTTASAFKAMDRLLCYHRNRGNALGGS